MKKLIIAFGIFSIILNTVALLIFNDYDIFNNILVTSSLLSTCILIYFSLSKNIADAYRISLPFIYSFLGMVKIVLSIFSKSTIKENCLIIWLLGIVFIEIIILLIIDYMKKHTSH
jgi:hypothetical protein